ncbi:MAG TPA: S8 family serine peptidase, partial [Rhodothermales bacterium]|nr:S8 family serine peptidase [Rhodothermales bacterium]
STVSPDTLEEFEYYLKIKADFEAEREETARQLAQIGQAEAGIQEATRIVEEFLNTDSLTKDQLMGLKSIRQDVLNARGFLLYLDANGITPEIVAQEKEHLQHSLDFSLNPDFNPRGIVGDHYADASERYYGNNDVAGPDPGHGTSVAGVIAAERGNGLGIDGIADSVRIMVVRTVPNGDERDKDVANAIRYAIDNGARIVNMSFGKDYSPQKAAVDAAVRYAQEKGVLLIHAAGNDGADIDSSANFPSKAFLNGTGTANNWIEVGASSFAPGPDFVAYWSNYGQEVDVFAPGVAIYSTAPGQRYRTTQGTSLSAPVVTGVAALIESYYPQFTATQVRDIILQSAVRYPGEQVDIPGTGDFQVDFSQLSASGGVVNAYNALKRAQEMAAQQ